jgi:hypothetical protein
MNPVDIISSFPEVLYDDFSTSNIIFFVNQLAKNGAKIPEIGGSNFIVKSHFFYLLTIKF